jgi:hypothetical protein
MSILEALSNLTILPRSLVATDEAEYGMAQTEAGLRLAILAKSAGSAALHGFDGERSELSGQTLILGSTSPRNAAALRTHLPWLKPRPLGLRTSAGMGDRLGLATPGHVRAVRAVQSAGGNIAPIFAQQSIREMARTRRTPQQVMDDATWGTFQEGWREGMGADADHLKTTDDIDVCLAAGFTFFTIDPGEHVDNRAEQASHSDLRAALDDLPWKQLDDKPAWLTGRYLNQSFEIEEHTITFDEHTLLRAAAKYGRAVAHVAVMYRHLMKATSGWNCELEVSVDETELPTTHAEHVYIAKELRRLGVHWVSLAPRYVGRFEKGVDYISPSGKVGDVSKFEADFAVHATIARVLGPYKLSLHSGSDKFSIYPIAARQSYGLVHLKTAGTSYLEALHTIASLDPQFFRDVYVFARERYETDKASYHVSAQLNRAPRPEDVSDADLPKLLDHFDAREILHVTFGSVLTQRASDGRLRFYDRFMDLLRKNLEAYAANLEAHFVLHLKPFVSA